MDIRYLNRHFARIGAEIDAAVVPWGLNRLRTGALYVIDVDQTRRGERFALHVATVAAGDIEWLVLDVAPRRRHLLLQARHTVEAGVEKRTFVCGHDERHWFVAEVPEAARATSVGAALEALKPAAAVEAQRRGRVKAKDRHRRRNAGFVRQGEWFFIPHPDFAPPSAAVVLRDEPIRRGAGKPHRVDEVYRTGGETVYVCWRHPEGLTEAEYRELIRSDPRTARLSWSVMRRNPTVFARGRVRHPDHATIRLRSWHRVVLSNEPQSQNVAFLD